MDRITQSKSVIIRSLRQFKDQFFTDARRAVDQTVATEMKDVKVLMDCLDSLMWNSRIIVVFKKLCGTQQMSPVNV